MTNATSQRFHDVPIYWFAKLDRAVEDGDFGAAAEAQRHLERLGVHVRYKQSRPPPPSPKLCEVAHDE
jgi:hypothetical protein